MRRHWPSSRSKASRRRQGHWVHGGRKGDGYKADDVECKDGQYDMTLDKDFKITGKEKED